MVFSEPQPPSGLYKLSTNQQQVPRGSYMNSEEWQELCEGREHVCSSFASSALSSTAHTWQTDHICWGEERTSQQRTISTGNVVFWAFQTRCPSHRPHQMAGIRSDTLDSKYYGHQVFSTQSESRGISGWPKGIKVTEHRVCSSNCCHYLVS